VARIAALEFGDDGRSGIEPPHEDLHGRATYRVSAVGEVDMRLAS